MNHLVPSRSQSDNDGRATLGSRLLVKLVSGPAFLYFSLKLLSKELDWAVSLDPHLSLFTVPTLTKSPLGCSPLSISLTGTLGPAVGE